MPTIHSVADSVALADKRLLRAYPRIVKELTAADEKLDRLELDGFLKLLPSAVERFEANSTENANAIDASVLAAIQTLTTSFGSRNAVAVDTEQPDSKSNTEPASVEMAEGVSAPELPEGSDTSQQPGAETLPHNELAATAGNGGEASDQQTDGPNPRVRRRKQVRGKALYRQRLQELAESADNRG